jgi:ABC-type polysaccharide/polyol phosphate transport system ATPase subunit
MTTPVVIETKGLSKRFFLQQSGSRTLKSAVLGLLRPHRRREFWALRDVTFSVRRGETLGIIGANGSGKSTLLSLLAGTLTPTRGTVRVEGRISSLLELGAGFHPELTGRENVFLWGSIMGLSRATMRERFERIVEFAELREYIDQPVKFYSSGMYVRLGFAVAVEVDPDVMLVDEVLAVGDLAFQKKCLDRMAEFRKRDKTMLIVSHDMRTIQAISHRILFLDAGQVRGEGDPGEMVDRYEHHMLQSRADALRREWGTREAVIERVEIGPAEGPLRSTFRWNEPIAIRMAYRASQPLPRPCFAFSISDSTGRLIHSSQTAGASFGLDRLEGEGRVCLRLPGLPLAAGDYLLSFALLSADRPVPFHALDRAFPIRLEGPPGASFEGVFVPTCWERYG